MPADPANIYAREFLCTLFSQGVPVEVAYTELVKNATDRAHAGGRVDAMSSQPLFEAGRAYAAKLAARQAAP